MIPFDYNLLILVAEHASMVWPTTFIVKFLKKSEPPIMDLGVGKAMGSRKTLKPFTGIFWNCFLMVGL